MMDFPGFGFFPSLFDPTELLKVILISSILVVVGLFLLWGRLLAVPRPWGFLLGLGFIAGGLYYVYVSL